MVRSILLFALDSTMGSSRKATSDERIYRTLVAHCSLLFEAVGDVDGDRDAGLAGLDLRRRGAGAGGGGGGILHVLRGAGRARLVAHGDNRAEFRAARAD